MTAQPPQASPSAHLDPDRLADLDADLLDRAATAAAERHLAECPSCRDRRAAMGAVTRLLRDSAMVGPMPDDVRRRIDDALAAGVEPPARSAATTITPLSAPHRTPWTTRLLQAAAVFVLLAAVAGVGYSAVSGSGGGSGGGSEAASQADPNKASGGDATTGTYPVTESGRAYTQQSLRAAVPLLLSGRVARADAAPEAAPSGGAGGGTATGSGNFDRRLLSGRALAACVANIAETPVTPLAVDVGTYNGKPATVLVLPTPDNPRFVDVYVVAPDCPRGTWMTLERVTRP
jgi:hypothetical protein